MKFAKQNPKEDLRQVSNPQNRLDVLGYNLAMGIANHLEKNHGFSGLSQSIEPHVQELAKTSLQGVTIPPEAMILLGLIGTGINRQLNPPNSNIVLEGQNNASTRK